MSQSFIPFNKPYLIGNEVAYIKEAVERGHISGNGYFTKKCHALFSERYGFRKCLLTTSCTDALEMISMLLDLQPGDEVIVPAYTFVSTANAFVLRGARIVFADSCPNHPNIDATKIESLITKNTKAIVVVHYAGVACDMDHIMSLARTHNLFVVEDAAQAIDSFHNGRPLGSIGHFSAFSFHETKNIISGEGGLLVVNDERFEKRSDILWEKGTNRTAFFKGEVDKYGWVDIGSSFLPSEVIAAFLYAQLEKIEIIQKQRKEIWKRYSDGLKPLEGKLEFPHVPGYATQNGHMFYVVCKSESERDAFIRHLRNQNVYAVFHYLSLQKSPYYSAKHDGRQLQHTDRFSECLVRLPMFFDLTIEEQQRVIDGVKSFFGA